MKTLAFSHQISLRSANTTVTNLAKNLAKDILNEVMEFRRTPSAHSTCDTTCSTCHLPHLSKVNSAILQKKPITFVLPAFPGKSPNLAKVLGVLPDMAEQRSLEFLNHLCDRIQMKYAPGARIILCSDGRIFSDVVGMREEDVTAYQVELGRMIEELSLKNISTFNLDELYNESNFDQMRRDVMEKYGRSLESLQEKIRLGGKPGAEADYVEANRMYCGITRFLVEDSVFPSQNKSRTAIQKDGRVRAYEVIRRSNAWTELIAEKFPSAIRLSIHPQVCGSKKLGIRLIGTESWMTPWHGVGVETENGFVLLKRAEAEAKGARLVFSSRGLPSHYELTSSQELGAVL